MMNRIKSRQYLNKEGREKEKRGSGWLIKIQEVHISKEAIKRIKSDPKKSLQDIPTMTYILSTY